MIAIGPLEILRSPRWEEWRASWHWQPSPRGGVWMYRWAICTPYITIRWVSRTFIRYLSAPSRGGAED